jgi:acyl-[acyl carrier protein]--UDP-N-acetylglucosamine O-acyltransferase
MNQRNTTRTILAGIIAAALLVSIGGLTALHKFARIGGYYK